MLTPVILGLVAAASIVFPLQLASTLEAHFPQISLTAPIFLLGITGFAMLLQKFVLDRGSSSRSYDGLPDLFIHIHSIGSPDSALRWFVRGVNSLFLAIFGGVVGLEGVATEFSQALAIRLRTQAASRFEQRRRTDASVALAAGVSAAFGAPFAGILLPIELGVGGPVRPAVVAALSAFVGLRFFSSLFASNIYYNFAGVLNGFQLGGREALGILTIAIAIGGAVAVLYYFVSFVQENIRDLFHMQTWMRTLAAGVLLFFVAVIYKSGHAFPSLLLERVLWGRFPAHELGMLLLTQTLTLALILAGFGTIGILWPLFVLGSVVGVSVNHWIFHDLSGFAAAAGVAGAAALLGGMLRAPLTAALVAWELTGSVQSLFIGGGSALLAQLMVRFLRVPGLIEKTMEARGVDLIDGRSAAILDAIFVRDAMMVDHETIHEHEPISEIHGRLVKAKHPFLPVTTAQGVFKGLLTVDLVQSAWEDHQNATLKKQGTAIMKLLEAKDLLYRAGVHTPTVRVNDRLTKTAGLFDETPCVPVLFEDGRVAGLLFVFNVRQAYDREVARRSLLQENIDV